MLVVSAVHVGKHDERLEGDCCERVDEQRGEEILVDRDARDTEDPTKMMMMMLIHVTVRV